MTPSDTILRPCTLSNREHAPHLILCPFAGASGSAFTSWRSLNDVGLDMSLVTYPGHDHRMKEAPEPTIYGLADQIASEIERMPRAKQESVLLGGHSMGAQVAFEACLRLEALGCPPAGLVLSGCHAPHLISRRRLSHLNDQAFIDELISMGGCDPLLRQNPTLLLPFLPMLRTDFNATESYHRDLQAEGPRLTTPTLLLCGTHDIEARHDEVAAWSRWIDSDCRFCELTGEHFYITQRPRAFAGKAVEFYFQSFVLS
jgi:yersiniabactin synthetase, thioesterase component